MYFKSSETQLFEKYKSMRRDLVVTEAIIGGKSDEMDKDTFDKFHLRIARCKSFLDEHHPWFGIFLSKLKTCPTYDLDTMGVDDFGNIYINPDFALARTEGETIGVLAHEVMHVITLTFFRQNARQMTLWNITTDFVMNKMLLEANFALPKEGCIPEKRPNGDWFVVLKDEKTGVVMGEVNITNMSEEKLYDEIVKIVEKQDDNNKKEKPKGGMKNKVFQVGDRVKSRETGLKGTVTSVKGLTPRKQTLSIKWD